VDAWLDALRTRHTAAFTGPQFLKAVRALSARYVEGRARLASRAPLDSAGKRAAFAAFYAPLHFLTTREVVRALGATRRPLDRIVDLGCGTGAASAAWALELSRAPRLEGVDTQPWVVAEAAWTWRQFGLRGLARRGDLVLAAERLAERPADPSLGRTGVLLAWSANELDEAGRRRLLAALTHLAARGACVLVIEPIARRATPWWHDWATTFVGAGGRADDWKFDVALPASLEQLNEAAGFSPRTLSARSLAIRL
jgi:hypothetical protein